MPFYRYSALDARGAPMEGTIQAANPTEAASELAKRGFSQAKIIDPNVLAPASKPASRPVRTGKLNDKHRFFLFAQISDQFRAGINPGNALTAIANVTRRKDVADSLRRAGESAIQGGRISDVFEQYPALYPKHVSSVVRAGEEAGFLPAAFMRLAEQSQAAYKFKRFHWFVWMVALNALLAIPLVIVATQAFLRAFKKFEQSGSSGIGDAGVSIIQAFAEVLVWPMGPIILGVYAVIAVLYAFVSSDRFKMWRHRLGLSWPVLGPRGRHEGIHIFTWTLSKLSHAGISPFRSWELAAEAVPNLELSRRLVEAGDKIQAGSRLSEVVFGSKLFPDEYGPVLATGEMTGDVVSALERLADMSKTEFDASTTYAKARTTGWGCLGMIITAGILLAVLFYFFYHQLLGAALEGLPNPETMP